MAGKTIFHVEVLYPVTDSYAYRWSRMELWDGIDCVADFYTAFRKARYQSERFPGCPVRIVSTEAVERVEYIFNKDEIPTDGECLSSE